ncbi:hypothetical protein SBRCBS47491_002366 [Sporothrix bragantina]|uniref:Major facilitator superfamily (MFS) profile domain-containing protein n=1 Tax=Sporothrix bragantina TaxID=671064 RepID=A0ABP0B691_9PEZI
MAHSPWSWPMSWRIIILLNISFYNLLGNSYAAGLSNVLALPLATLIGKRYTVLLSLTLFLGACLWSGEATSFASLRASRLLGGLAGGLIEALGPHFVIETFPEHQLARAMVIYVGLLAGGSAVGPIVSGAIGYHLDSWRWFLRVLSIAIFCTLLSSLAMLPETTHDGPLVGLDGFLDDGDRATDDELAKYEARAASQVETADTAKVDNAVTTNNHAEAAPSSLWQEYKERSWSLKYVRLQQWREAVRGLYQPLMLLMAPQVVVTVVVFGLTVGWTVVMSIVTASVYAQPPVLFNSLQVGLISIGPLLGLIVGLPIGGAFADWLANRSLRRHGGEHRPASRLPAAFLGGLVSPAGCVVFGYGMRDPAAHWAQVCVGWGMLCVGLTGSSNVLLTYAVDCLPTRAAHIGMLINLAKNLIGFGVSYASISWYESAGPVRQFGTMAGLLFAANLCIIPIAIYSKRVISKTAWLA